MKYIFVLMVFVVGDDQWREWNSYNSLEACEEIIQVLTYYREDKIKAYCLAREVEQ
jgi:hypothetical protein